MVQVEIIEFLYEQVEKKFKREADKIFDLMHSLENSPTKGRVLGQVGGIVIKEIRYESFRFYFIVDGFKLRCLDRGSLEELLIRFVRMSDKRDQQKIIDEIKRILQTIGPSGFL